MATKKINPRHRPASQADVTRAYQDGFDKGITGALSIMLYTLHDKFAADDTQLMKFADAFNYTLDSLNRGYISQKDLECVLKDEYGTTIVMK